MAKKEFNKLVFIGRFQPFHNGHAQVIQKALELADEVVVIIGSAFQARTLRNPFTFEERKSMIWNHFKNVHLRIEGVMDRPYSDHLWIADVKNAVYRREAFTPDPQKCGLIGHKKDGTSYYLDLFPGWESVDVENTTGLDATRIRDLYFDGNLSYVWGKGIPESTLNYLEYFRESEEFKALSSEKVTIRKYKEAWGTKPHPPIFVTADALVVQSEHILLVERKANPGKGLLALPGGFVEQDEKILDAAIRELRQETKLKVPEPVLKGSVKKSQVFDDPKRSARGRTITHAYMIDLGFGKLPKVKGGDDARKAFWLPLSELDSTKMFEDHFHIIQEML